jgi:hypothetical protein
MNSPFVRKKGTPAHWCLAWYMDKFYWLDPAKLDDTAWD